MQVKRFVVSNPISQLLPPKPIPHTFVVKAKKGKWWEKKLYNLAWKLVNKYGNVQVATNVPEYDLSYSEVIIDYEHIESLIYHHEQCLKAVYNRDVEYILVGRDVMSAMSNNNMRNFTPINTEFPADYESRTKYHGQLVTFNGVRLKFVPYFEGFVAVLREDY